MKAQHLSTQEVCLFLGISLSTFYRYCKRGLLKPSFFTLGGHRRFSIQELQQTFSINNNAELVVCYSRVSSHDQKNDLITQENKLLAYAQTLASVKQEQIISITDLGSGLNYKKKGLKQLLSLMLSGKIKTLIINHKDRLLRFGRTIDLIGCKNSGISPPMTSNKTAIILSKEPNTA